MHKGRALLLQFVGVTAATLLVFSPVFADTTGELLPNGDGTYTQWTPGTGSTHFNLVDDTECGGLGVGGDYVETSTTGNRDSYTLPTTSIPDGSAITGVTITPCLSRPGAGNPNLKVFFVYNAYQSPDRGNFFPNTTKAKEYGSTTLSGVTLFKTQTGTLQIGGVFSGTTAMRIHRMSAIVTYTPLVAPSNLSGSTMTGTTVFLSWTDNSSIESGFVIERSVNSPSAFAFLKGVGANVTNTTDSTVSSGNTYYYRIRTYTPGGNSGFSNNAFVIVP